jgi:aspartate aminotransferase
MLISKKMAAAVSGSSMIRKMFEEGTLLKAKYGADQVYDFSIGNPDVPPPPEFKATLTRLVAEDRPGSHGYMANAGWPDVREKVGAYVTKEQGQGLKHPFTARHIIMTAGAAGAINALLRSILEPGDEVLTPRPYFVEYGAYVENFGGKLVAAEPGPGFTLNVQDIVAKITPQTRAVLINSPHNPTGVIYKAGELAELGRALTAASQKHGRPIALISDEPYRKLAYGMEVPSVFLAYNYAIAVTSYSKDLSLAGERIGYLAINPDMPEEDIDALNGAVSISARVLGMVNANSLMQLVMAELQGVSVDINLYERRRDIFVEGLRKIGYEFNVPDGAFYLFPKSPLADDLAFVNMLKEERVLTVPGSGFKMPGYFRICYCVSETTIKNSMPGFARAFEKASK